MEIIDSCQNRLYTAPDVLKEKEFGIKSDIYSFGVLMHFILCEKEAILDENGFLDLTKTANLNDKTENMNDKWNNLNDEWKKLIINCTLEDPTKRPTAKDILTQIFQTKRHFQSKLILK